MYKGIGRLLYERDRDRDGDGKERKEEKELLNKG